MPGKPSRHWIRKLRELLLGRPSDQRDVDAKRQARRTWRLGFEILEDRLTPSTFIVTDPADAAGSATDVTLRYAVTNAQNGDQITFANTLSGDTITLGSVLTIATNVTINGLGAANLAISGNNATEVFTVHSGVTADISNLTIEDGTNDTGGGILNKGTLTLSNATLTGNSATQYGGGILNNTGASLTLSNVTLSDNTAIPITEGGGAVFNLGNVSMADTTISGNSAGYGAGINNQDSATATLSDCTFSDNTAHYAGGAIYDEPSASTPSLTLSNCTLSGNSAHNSGGGILNEGLATLTDVTLAGNTAVDHGGGIVNQNHAVLTLTNTTLFGNSATAGYGGGIQNENEATLTIVNSTISGNSAVTGGGVYGNGVLNGGAVILNTVVAGNSASTAPDYDGTAALADDDLIGNASGLAITSGTGNQTGVSNPGLASTLANNGCPTLTLALLPGSPALAASGALTTVATGESIGTGDTTIYVQNAAAIAATPGDYYILIDSEQMLVTNVNLSNNTLTVVRGVDGTTAATHSTGASVFLATDERGNARDGTPDVGAFQLTAASSHSVTAARTALTLSASGTAMLSFLDSSSNTPTGTVEFLDLGTGTVLADASVQLFNGSYMAIPTLSAGSHTIMATYEGDSNFQGSSAVLSLIAGATSSSAALPVNSTTLTINGDGFDTNPANDSVAFSNGVTGTVSAASATSLDITGLSNLPAAGTALYGTVTVDGTATPVAEVATISSSTVIYVVTSTGNSATTAGTLPYAIANAQSGEEITFASSLSDGTITLSSVLTLSSNVTITGLGTANLAISGNNACEVFDVNSGVAAIISDLTIEHGSAASGGGILNAGTLSLSNAILSGNSASSGNHWGGGMYNDGGSATICNVTFSDNSAGHGGGFFNLGGNMTLSNVTLSCNSAPTGGGGFFVEGGSVVLSDATLSGNSGEYGGGGYIYSGAFVASNSTLAGNTATSGSGGGIYIFAGSLTLSNVTVSENSAASEGGGIYDYAGNTTLGNVTFSENSAEHGGGTFVRNGNVVASNVTVTGNTATGAYSGGGGIFNEGTLTLANSTLSGNVATDGSGGGIVNAGYLTLAGTTLSGNSAEQDGGGLENESHATLTNTTLYGNTAGAHGGGIFDDNGITLNLSNATVSANSAVDGGGIAISTSSPVTLLNTIVTGNTATSVGPNVDGTVAVADNSLFGTATGMTITTSSNNQLNVSNPGLAASLADYGGPTQTLALQSGSPAIAAGGAITTVTSDSGGTTITVADAAAIASTPGAYLIQIDAEQMLVTNVNPSTNTLTVIRGYNGTTVVTHSSGAGVFLDVDQRGYAINTNTTTPDIGAYQSAGSAPGTPTVTGVSPIRGAPAGGTSVTITGANLANATNVGFGGQAGTIVSDTGTTIVATTPAESGGTVDTAVTTVGWDTTATSTADQFTFGPAYAVSLDSSGNLAITQEVAGANDNLMFSLSGGTYTFTDTGGLTFDNPTGADASDITGVGTSTITIPSADVASISVVLGTGTNVFTFSSTNGAAAAPITVNTGTTTGNAIDVTGAVLDSGAVSLTSTSILVGADLSATGNVTLLANTAGTATGNFVGVSVIDGATLQSTAGNVVLQGTGGQNGVDVGIEGSSSGTVEATGSSGTVTIEGAGGASSNNAVGVAVGDGLVTSGGGNVSVTGQGGGSSNASTANDFGVLVQNDATITAGGSGTVTVQGTGGGSSSSGGNNYGVYVLGQNSSVPAIVTSNGGAVAVTGTGGGGDGGDNIGVYIAETAAITSGGTASVTVQGTAGAVGTSPSYGVYVEGANSQITSAGGNVQVTGAGTTNSVAVEIDYAGTVGSGGSGNLTLTCDSLNIGDGGATIEAGSSGTATATIQPRTVGTLINLGGANVLTGSPLTLGLGENIAPIKAGTLNIGNTRSGTITDSEGFGAAANALALISGGDIDISGGQLITNEYTGTGTLLLQPGLSGSVKPTYAGADAAAGTVSIASNLTINIAGPTVDTQYNQFNVGGAVNLTGTNLQLSGSYVPVGADSFTIVSATSVSGAFAGLADGSTVVFNGATLTVHYTATAVILVNTDVWTNSGSGDWDSAADWSLGSVPIPGNDVLIHTAAAATITIQSGDSISVNSLTTAAGDTLSITGGSLAVADDSTLSGPLTMTGGSLTVSAAGVTLLASGTTSINTANLYALAGATLSLPQLTSYIYAGPGDYSTGVWQADGTGSAIDMPGLTSFTGSSADLSSATVEATNGGVIDLHNLAQAVLPSGLTGPARRNISFIASGSGSLVNLSALTTLADLSDSPWETSLDLEADSGGEVDAPLLTSVTEVSLTISGSSSILPISQYTAITDGSITVSGVGNTRTFANLVSVNGSSLIATGSGTLNLPLVTDLYGATAFGASTQIEALAGGNIDLSALQSISGGTVALESDGSNSVLNLTALNSITVSAGQANSSLQVTNNGTVTGATGLTSLQNVNLTLDGTGAWTYSQVTNDTDGVVTLTGGRFTLSATDIDGSNFEVSGGAMLSLPGAAGYNGLAGETTTLEATGAGSTLSLPYLAGLTGDTTANSLIQIEALAGGDVAMPVLTQVNGGAALLASDGAGSVLNVPALSSFSAANASGLQASNGGTVDIAGGVASMPASGAGATITVPALPAGILAPVILLSSGTLSGGTTLNVPQGETIDLAATFTGGIVFNVAHGSTVDLANDSTITCSGTLSGSGGGTVQRGSGTLLVGPGGLTLNFPAGMFQWAGGTIEASSVNVTNLGTIDLTGAGYATIATNAAFDDYGTILQAGADNLVLEGTGAFAAFNIESGGVYLMQSDAGIANIGDTVAIDNAGAIRKTGGSGGAVLDGGGPLNNTGTIEADAGVLTLGYSSLAQLSGTTLTGGTWNAEGGTLDINSLGVNVTVNQANVTLDGPGSSIPDILPSLVASSGNLTVTGGVSADITQNGAFTNSGTLTIGAGSTLETYGSAIQTTGGTLNVQIGGTPGSGLYGQLISAQTATLGGTLSVALVDGFGPSIGQSYTVVSMVQTINDFVGAFAQINGLSPFFTASYNGGASVSLADAALSSVDLAATSVTAPATANPGQQITVHWQGTNISTQAATGSWQDSVYLSPTPALTTASILLGSVRQTGGLAAGNSYNASLSPTLPALPAGAYYVVVQIDSLNQVPDGNRANNVLAATTGALDITLPVLTLSTPHADSFTAADQDRYYQIMVPAGGSLNVSLQSSASAGAVALYVSEGVLPTAYNYQNVADVANQPSQTLTVPSVLTAGTYYILAHSISGAAATSGYSVTVTQSAQLSVYSYGPQTGANAGNLTVEIDGANFTPAVTASLTLGGTPLNAEAIDFVSASQIFVTFNLTGVTVGAYTLTVTQGAQSVPGGPTLQVTAASSSALSLVLNTPQLVRSGRTGTVIVSYTNETNNDMVAPLLDVTSTNPDIWFSTPDDPNLFTQSGQVLAVASSGPAGILRPGQGGQLTLSLLSDDPIDGDQIPIQVGLIAASQPIDWQTAEASLQPANVPDAAWNVIYSNLLATVGNTTGSYNAALAQAATYLGGLGETTAQVSDVGRLWSFLETQANASYPTASLASVVDASLATPGNLPLAIDRTFVSSLSGRYEPGIFGLGWVTSWQTSLSADGYGNVTIDRDDSPALFDLQPDGTFLDTNAETGTLTNSAGVYTYTTTAGTQYVFLPASGLLNYEQDANGNRITLGYNAQSQLVTLTYTSETDPAEPSEQMTLTYTQGLVTQVTDSAGDIWSYSYDTAGHLLSVTGPGNLTTTYTYTPGSAGAETANALLSITNPDGSGQTFTYDAATGRLTGAAQNGANPVTYTYDGEAEITATDAAGDQTIVWYNDLGLPSRIDNPLGGISNYTYDADGNVLTYVNAAGDTYQYSYDGNGNLTQTVNPLGQTVQLTYGALSKLTSVTDADGNKTQYSYSAAGNLLSIAYPDGTQQSFTYDPLGNLTDTIEQNGDPVAYQVNAQGLVTQETFADGSSQAFSYDGHGNMLTALAYNSSGTLTGATSLSYNAADELTSITYPNGQYLNFTYNGMGQRIQSIDQSGFTILYTYLGNGQLAELTDGSNNLIVQYTYNTLGQLQTKLNGNGTSTTYSYDAAGDLLSEINYASGTTVNSSFTYAYNALGQKTSMTDSAGNVTLYAYDAAGELTQVTLPNGQIISYVYNAAGDFSQVITSGTPTSYASNADNEITQVGSSTYTYSANGNLQTVTDASGTTTYAYNDLNQLVSTTAPDGSVTSFQYSPLGFLVGTDVAGSQTNYLVDPTGLGTITASYNGSGTLDADYVYGLGLVSQTGSAGAGYYDFDGSGNTIGITGATGAYENQYSYLPFGATTTIAQALPNPFTFAGQQGALTLPGGLVLIGDPVYDPATGQFTSNDAANLDAGDANLRQFTGDDVVDWNAPSAPTPQAVAAALKKSTPPSVPEPAPPDLPPPSAPPSVPGLPPVEASPVLQPTGTIPAPATQVDASGASVNVTSNDPNALLGPAGVGPANDILPVGAWSYTVDFENDGSVAAQNVVITEQLDASLDWSTFQLGSFAFGPIMAAVPVGLTQYETTVAYQNADGTPLNVAVGLNFNVQTGILTATLTSLDPLTGQAPAGIFAGFLPPDNASGIGEGYVQYTVQPLAGLHTGVIIAQKATVAFDTNPPDSTNTYTNTIDAGFPADQLVLQAPMQAIAGGMFTARVLAEGANGQVDSLATGSASLLLTGGPNGGILSGVITEPLVNGVATFTNLSLNLASSAPYTLFAAGSGILLGSSANVAVTTTTHFSVTGAPASSTAGNSFTVTVHALNASNQVDTNYVGTITFTSSDKQAVLPSDYTFLPSDHGVKTFTITLKTAGAQTVTVADVTRATAAGRSSVVNVTALTTVVGLSVAAFPTPDVTAVAHTFVVTAVDAYGNKVSGYRGAVKITSSDASAVLPANHVFTAANAGAFTFTATLESLGTQSLTATDTVSSSITGAESNIGVVSSATHLSVTSSVTTTPAGQQVTITVKALNAANQVDTLFQDTVHFTSSDKQGVLPSDYTFLPSDHGVKTFTVTLKTAGSQTITAADLTRTAIKGTSARITVTSLAAASLSVKDFPNPDLSGVSHTFVVTALDIYGNIAPSYRGAVKITSSDASAVLPANHVFTAANAGVFTFTATLESLGTQSLTATDTVSSSITGAESNIGVVSSATHLSVTSSVTTTPAGQQVTITVKALNAANQVDTLFQDTVQFTSSDKQGVLPSDYTFLPSDHGVKTFTVTLKTAGRQTITAADLTRTAVTGTSARITVTPLAAASLSVKGFPNPDLSGVSHTFVVTALDIYGNIAPSYRGAVKITSSDASAVLPANHVFTAANAGVFTFTATLESLGTQSLTATDTVSSSITGAEAGIYVATLTPGVAGQTVGVRGQPLTFTLSANESNAASSASFRYTVNWGDGTVLQTITGPAGTPASHVFATTGAFTVKVTATDTAGNLSPTPATQIVAIHALALETDPANSSDTALVIGGTTGSDVITITPTNAAGTAVSVSIDGVIQPGGPFAPTGHILVYGQAGADTIREVAAVIAGHSASVAVPAVLFAGSGSSVLSVAGSSANNVLVGGAGNDTLTGGSGRDILIGGGGANSLHAGSGADILIGGATAYNANLTALFAIMAEWARNDVGYLQRVADLFGNGSGGLNGAYLLDPTTVTPDTAQTQLLGGSNQDWLWIDIAAVIHDKVNNLTTGDIGTIQ